MMMMMLMTMAGENQMPGGAVPEAVRLARAVPQGAAVEEIPTAVPLLARAVSTTSLAATATEIPLALAALTVAGFQPLAIGLLRRK